MIIINKEKLKCPRCGAKMVPAINLLKTHSTSWMVCEKPNCPTYLDTYIPQPFQVAVHEDPIKHVGVFGGYGSGKTTTCMKDDEKHMLSTPAGSTAVGSAVLSQVEQTYEKDFRKDFPSDFVIAENKTKKEYTLGNGHTLFVKSFYEEGLLRSLTLSRYHIVEASEADYPILTQLHARLRDLNGTVPEKTPDGDLIYDPLTDSFKVKADWRRGFVESNPDAGWIRSHFLLKSGIINIYNDPVQDYFVDDPNPYLSSHIIPTRANRYLPPNFYAENAAGKPAWWVRRYLQGSFDYAEGMVYPEIMSTFCDPFPIPSSWKRLIAMDYGIRDETAIIFGAIDDLNRVLYIFHEIYINNVNYKVISGIYKNYCSQEENVPVGSLLRPPVMDARSINKRNDRDLATIGELFLEEGVYFDPAQMDIDARVLKVNTMVETGQLKIFKTCTNLTREIREYKFPDRNLNAKAKQNENKPQDKLNHAVNALEFLCMEAPHDLSRVSLNAYHGSGNLIQAYSSHTLKKQLSRFQPFEDTITSYADRDEQGDFGALFNN